MFINIKRFVVRLLSKQATQTVYAIPDDQQNKALIEELIIYISTSMGKIHAGFRSSYGGKGIREGLYIGKQAIKSSAKYFIGYENYREYGDDEIRLKQHLLSLLRKENSAKYKPYKSNLINLVHLFNFNIFKHAENESDDSNAVTFYETDQLTMVRFNYYNQLKKSLQTQIHFNFAHLSPEEIAIHLELLNHCFTQIYQTFMQTTCYKPIVIVKTFFTKADLAIQKQIDNFNRLPGNDGTYELVGLHGVRDYLNYYQKNILYNQSDSN